MGKGQLNQGKQLQSTKVILIVNNPCAFSFFLNNMGVKEVNFHILSGMVKYNINLLGPFINF